MKLIGGKLAIYQIPPRLTEPFSDAVQRGHVVEVLSLSLLTDTDVSRHRGTAVHEATQKEA